MLTAYLWHSKTDIIVPIHGGPWDGATILCTNLQPGRVTRIGTEPYRMAWANGQPRLEYTS